MSRPRSNEIVELPRTHVTAAADAAMDVTAVAHTQVFIDDPKERRQLEAAYREIDGLIYEVAPIFVGRLLRVRSRLAWLIDYDDRENDKHRQQLAGGRQWAHVLDLWSIKGKAASVFEADAA
jgi:hypothetical protein